MLLTMPARAAPNTGRQKVRCPKCTAFFTKPAISVFECPICSCSLSGNGMIALTENFSYQKNARDSGQGMALTGSDELTRTQSPMGFVKEEGPSSEGNKRAQEKDSMDCEGDKGASPAQIDRIKEQQPLTYTGKESPRVSENDNKGGQPSVDETIEGIYGNDGVLSPHCPEEEAALVGRDIDTIGKLSSDTVSKEDPLLVKKEGNLVTAKGIAEQTCVEKDGAINRHLQSQVFRTTRCEFSFKYSLGGASPLESDSQSLQQKRSPSSRTVSSEMTIPNTEASDTPLYSPLRVRISNSHEESSDQSEHGRYSFNSETDSCDGSESEFDFPAPWAEGPHDIVLPASFGQNEICHPNLDDIVSASPHQLELQDVYDPIDHEEFTLQESWEHLKGAKGELPSQVEDACNIMSDAGPEAESKGEKGTSTVGLLQPALANGKNDVVLEAPDKAESPGHIQSLDHHSRVLDLAKHENSVMLNYNLDEVDSNEIRSMEGGRQKLGGPGSDQGFGNGEGHETVLNQNTLFHQVKARKAESNANVQQEVSEPLDVVASLDGGQVSKLSVQCNGIQESINYVDNMKPCKKDLMSLPSCSDTDFTSSAILSNQEDLQFIGCSDETHSIPSIQMVESPETGQIGLDHSDMHHNMMSSVTIGQKLSFAREGQLADSLLSNMSKIERSYNGPDAGDCNMSSLHISSHMKNAELELDLYSQHRLPRKVPGKDSSLGKNLYSDLWAEKNCAVTALSDGMLMNTSIGRMYYEESDPLKSSQGKLHDKSELQSTRSGNGEDHFMSGSDRILRGPAASQGMFFQPSSVHSAAEENRNHHPDLHEMDGKSAGSYSQYPTNNLPGFSLANSQPYALTNHHFVSDHLGFGASSSNQMYSYQLPSQSLVLPTAFQNHALTHCGYHAMSPACMLCSYHQHPNMMPQHIPHCAGCYSQPASVAYKSGHAEHWNYCQAHHDLASACASSLLEGCQACSFSNNLAQRHDLFNAELRSRSSSAKKVSQYPPLPKDSAAPYVTCKGCSRVLQVPSDLPPNDGIMQKIRCGACGKVAKFSVNHYNQQRRSVSSLPPPELDSMGGATNILPLVQYATRSRQLPVSTAKESLKSSYDHDMSHGSHEHNLNKVWPQDNNTTATIFTSRILEQNPQGGEGFRGHPRNHAFETSLGIGPSHVDNASSLTGAMSPRKEVLRSTDSFGFERSKVNPAASSHSTVDEKEEGLDFGAPRISDGDSLDHSESRMRSPENIQACHQKNHVEISQGVPLGGHPPEQVPELNWSEKNGTAAQEKTPGSPLLVLLNQESTRFMLNLDPGVPLEEPRSALCSPASDSSLYDTPIRNRPRRRERDVSHSRGASAQQFVSKGPKYITGLLRRSLRDFGRGGQ